MNAADMPPGVRAIVEALTSRAVARCHAEGYALGDFLAAVRAERAGGPADSLSRLFGRAFARLAADRN